MFTVPADNMTSFVAVTTDRAAGIRVRELAPYTSTDNNFTCWTCRELNLPKRREALVRSRLDKFGDLVFDKDVQIRSIYCGL